MMQLLFLVVSLTAYQLLPQTLAQSFTIVKTQTSKPTVTVTTTSSSAAISASHNASEFFVLALAAALVAIGALTIISL